MGQGRDPWPAGTAARDPCLFPSDQEPKSAPPHAPRPRACVRDEVGSPSKLARNCSRNCARLVTLDPGATAHLAFAPPDTRTDDQVQRIRPDLELRVASGRRAPDARTPWRLGLDTGRIWRPGLDPGSGASTGGSARDDGLMDCESFDAADPLPTTGSGPRTVGRGSRLSGSDQSQASTDSQETDRWHTHLET